MKKFYVNDKSSHKVNHFWDNCMILIVIKKIKPSPFIKILLILSLGLYLSGCGVFETVKSYNREQRFIQSSKRDVQFEQVAATETHPARFVVCGESQRECLETTEIKPHKKFKKEKVS